MPAAPSLLAEEFRPAAAVKLSSFITHLSLDDAVAVQVRRPLHSHESVRACTPARPGSC